MAGNHALLSPSAAEKWMGCPGSLLMEKGEVDKGSAHADEGTAAHFLASECLAKNEHPATCLSRAIDVGVLADGAHFTGWAKDTPDGFKGSHFVVDGDMVAHVNTYAQAVRKYAEGGALFIEQRLPITTWTGEPDAAGTSDAVVLTSDGELIVVDLKYGMGELVSPERNKQLMIYALAAYEEFSLVGDIKSVRLVIHQPRVHHAPQEWPVAVSELQAFGDEVRVAAEAALACYNEGHEVLAPSDAACRWCKAKDKCPAQIKHLTAAIGADFDDLTKPDAQVPPVGTGPTLAAKMAACDLIEKWIKAVRGKVEAELFAGSEVPGYKLVMGKKGARSWLDANDAEATLKSMFRRNDLVYTQTLISPTAAEKIVGEKGTAPSVKRWNKLQGLITQADGKPSVAPESDKRAAYVVDAVGAFEDETGSDMA
jgi:hypothetical protein